jgi:hypothetical protein
MSFPYPGSTFIPASAINFGTDPRYIEDLKRRKESIGLLVEALRAFLSLGIDTAIEDATRKRPRMPRPTIEDLNKAQGNLDLMHAQLEALQGMCEDMPEKLGEMMRVTQMPQVQRWFDDAQQQVSWIQKAMEEPEPDPSSPWDGSHQIGTLCAQCARSFEGVEHSVPALKVALKAAGWGRDVDGDHICPACVSAQKETA